MSKKEKLLVEELESINRELRTLWNRLDGTSSDIRVVISITPRIRELESRRLLLETRLGL